MPRFRGNLKGASARGLPMQGIYYLLSIVAVFVVIVWYIRNDGLKKGEPTSGLLAMKEPGQEEPPK